MHSIAQSELTFYAAGTARRTLAWEQPTRVSKVVLNLEKMKLFAFCVLERRSAAALVSLRGKRPLRLCVSEQNRVCAGRRENAGRQHTCIFGGAE
jgi:hypothetical protein